MSPAQLSVVRMVPVALALARAGRGRLAVYRLLNRYRGWDPAQTPVVDARRGLDDVAERFPGVPLGLVGHSLGGRAALLAGGHDGVRAVVALNPWLHPDDAAAATGLAGREVLVVHGVRDRVADVRRARALVRALDPTTSVELVEVADGQHAMLRHRREFDGRAAAFTARVLLGTAGTGRP